MEHRSAQRRRAPHSHLFSHPRKTYPEIRSHPPNDGMFGVSNSNHSFTHDCWTRPPAEVDEALPLDLKRCSLLREVAVPVPNYKAQEHLVRIVGTIRSHKLDTVVLIGPANSVELSTWATVDNELCALVDRLEEDGWKGRLRVLIYHADSKQDPFKEGQLLTRFRSKRSGEVVESVDNHLSISGNVRMFLSS